MNAREIVIALGGRWYGAYGVAKCPTHDDIQPSLSVKDGDNGDVVLTCFAGCDWRDVKAALRDKGLLPEWTGEANTKPASLLTDAEKARRQAEREVEEKRRIEYAQRIWQDAKDPTGTVVEIYLRSRAITLSPIPPTIRFANLPHGPTELLLPAMVCAVQGQDGDITGCHRTFLRADGKVKAPVTGNKMMIGKCRGGAVRFGKAGEKLAIGEGIETCLSVAQECPDLPVWAALSTSGLKTVVVPDAVNEIVILADNDVPGEMAAKEAATRFLRDGKTVKTARPLRKDFNDDLMHPSENVVRISRRGAHV